MSSLVNLLSTSSNVYFLGRYVYGAVISFSSRDYSHNVRVIDSENLSGLKRGTGGRSSFNGTVATVFGATGFVGRHLVNELGKTGTQVIIPYRCEPDDYSLKKLKLCGDLGQILFQPFDLRDPVSIRKAIKYSNVVINLIGNYFETRNFSFFDVHMRGAKQIAAACRELNIERLIHISSLNVTNNPQKIFFGKTYNFLPSKLEGEKSVFQEFPDATIIRPAIIFGLFDKFLRPLNKPYRATSGSFPLWAAGKKTVRQPVFVNDVVQGIILAMRNIKSKGKIYQAVGPERFLLSEIADYSGRVGLQVENKTKYHHDARFDPSLFMKILVHRYISGFFMYQARNDLCFEQLEMEAITDEVDPTLPTLEDLGVKLTHLKDKCEHLVKVHYLYRPDLYREYIEYVPVDPPKPCSAGF